MDKSIAQNIDELRAFPRLIMMFYAFMFYEMFEWAKSLPDLTSQQGIFAGAMMGLFLPLCNWYFNTGTKWKQRE